jgi:hypothetical protein
MNELSFSNINLWHREVLSPQTVVIETYLSEDKTKPRYATTYDWDNYVKYLEEKLETVKKYKEELQTK